MLDYVRWIFSLDFYTPRYLIMRELVMDKMRVGWGIRARRYEEKIKKGLTGRYRRERERYYNRNEWGIEAPEVMENGTVSLEKELINKEKDVQIQWENSRLEKARYNEKYEEIRNKERGPMYLKEERLELIRKGDEVRALASLKCRNMEEANKYWLAGDEDKTKYVFCGKGRDNIVHYVGECEEVSGRFKELGEGNEKVIDRLRGKKLDDCKGKIIKKLWKDKEIILRVRPLNTCSAQKPVPHNDRDCCGRNQNVINDVINHDRVELTTHMIRRWVVSSSAIVVRHFKQTFCFFPSIIRFSI
ncbi:hypothetical protein ALC60_09045 [Trachymyrmex zeteki]|uniref:Uncharacterized protein n=1 Tax=Mycetomoellerius zeteki TaxID=64791 RepID=A0A151WVE0_9HYME|nr:hypothetical protein ALC60_09045 [Trachymyrmex zeteki]